MRVLGYRVLPVGVWTNGPERLFGQNDSIRLEVCSLIRFDAPCRSAVLPALKWPVHCSHHITYSPKIIHLNQLGNQSRLKNICFRWFSVSYTTRGGVSTGRKNHDSPLTSNSGVPPRSWGMEQGESSWARCCEIKLHFSIAGERAGFGSSRVWRCRSTATQRRHESRVLHLVMLRAFKDIPACIHLFKGGEGVSRGCEAFSVQVRIY